MAQRDARPADLVAPAPADDEWPGPGPVSVVLPVLDGAATIEDQLEALSVQDYDGEWELIVSDNGSTDDTRLLLERWSGKLPHLRLVDALDVRGVAYARNAAVEAASGRFVALCDADDVVADDWLRELVAASAPGAVVAGTFDVTALNAPRVASWTGQSALSLVGVAPHLGFLPVARTANCGFGRDVWATLAGFDETMATGEDVDFSWRAQLAGYELRVAPDAVVRHRFRTTLRSMMRQAVRTGRSDAHLYATHRWHGVAPPKALRVLRSWAGLVLRLPRALVSPTWRGRWCHDAAYRWGRLTGSLTRGVWFP